MVIQRLKQSLVLVPLLLPSGGTLMSLAPVAIALPPSNLDYHFGLATTPTSAIPGTGFSSLVRNSLNPLKSLSPSSLEESSSSQEEIGSSSEATSTLLLEMDGVLEPGDRVAYQDGSLYDEYEIDGQQGQQIRIQLESLDFDPYLVLMHPNGDILAQNDDIAVDNLNAFLDYQLPVDGTYRVVANGFDRYSRGQYRLTILVLNADQSTEDDDDADVLPNR